MPSYKKDIQQETNMTAPQGQQLDNRCIKKMIILM